MNYSDCHNVMLISSHVCESQNPKTTKTNKGRSCTALYIAAVQGHDEVVSFLLAKGASPRIGLTYDVS